MPERGGSALSGGEVPTTYQILLYHQSQCKIKDSTSISFSTVTLMVLEVLVLCCLFCLPFIVLYCIYKPPVSLITYFQRRWPAVLFHVPTAKKFIALTIDDVPSENTKEILHILKANDVTATFFIIGSQVPGREELLQELIINGNELGNHTMYDQPSRPLKDTVLIEQMHNVESIICEAYVAAGLERPTPNYFRPGSGFFSARMLKVAAGLHQQLILGSIYPHDAQISSWRVNARHILSMLRPGGIIVCHDRSWTPPMLREVIPEAKRRGYGLVTVTKVLIEGGRLRPD